MTEQLPALPEDVSGGLDFPVAAPHIEAPKPILKIDHGKGDWSKTEGTWNYGGVCVDQLTGVFLAAREWRMLFAQPYRVNPDAPIVCASWDGVNAFGRGARDLQAPLEHRQCCEVLPGGQRKKLCPAAKGSGDDWICRPSNELFMMILVNDEWVPAFFDCRSRSIKPTLTAYQQAVINERASNAEHPRYLWSYTPKLVRATGKEGYIPVWGKASLLGEGPDRDAIVEFVSESAKQVWADQYQSAHDQAMLIGQNKDKEEAEEVMKDAEHRHNPENMPF